MMRLAFSVSLALCLVSVPVRADPPVAEPISTARLEYTRGPGAEHCPGEQDLRDAVGVRLGRDPFTQHAVHRLVVRLSGVGNDLYADVTLYDGAGRDRGSGRFVEASGDCARLLAVIGLRMGIALAPVRSAQSDPQSQPTAIERSAPAARAPTSPQPSTPLSPSAAPIAVPIVAAAAPWRVAVSAAGGFDVGNTPSTTAGLAAGVALGKGPWSVGLEARGYFPTSADGSAGGSAAVSLVTGGVVPCGSIDGPWTLFGCVVLSAGVLSTEGTGVDVPQKDSAEYVGVGPRIGLEFALSNRIALRIQGDVTYAPLTREVKLADEVVWTTLPVAVGASGGVVTFF